MFKIYQESLRYSKTLVTMLGRSVEAGAEAFLSKPFTLKWIKQCLEELVGAIAVA